jgi:hypothetical protein
MPRTPGTQPGPATPRSPQPVGDTLVAAGMSYPGLLPKGGRRAPIQKKAWQREAWEMFEAVGEFAFGMTWQSNVCSRARLVVKKRNAKGGLDVLPPTHAGVIALNQLTGGPEGQGEFIRAATLHLGVAAECYLVNRRMTAEDDPMQRTVPADSYVWEVVGTEEITDNGGVWTLNYENGRTVQLEETDTVIRVWMPHPRNRFNAYSLSKTALPIMREIVGFDSHIRAQQASRLTGNGLVLFPAEMGIKPPQSWDRAAADATTADIVTAIFMDAAMASKDITGTAADQVPITMSPPGEFIDKIRHIKFWTEFDDKVITGRNNSLVRLATTIDLPKEVVTGTGDMNRWGAWQVEESSIKVHIEPKLDMLAALLTLKYLQPALQDDSLVITVDTAVLRLRPNRSKEALELNDRGILSNAATLRETGFDPDSDGMEKEDWEKWMLSKMILGSWSPEMILAATKKMGIDLGIETADNRPREARPTPSLEDHPTQDPPEKSVSDGTADDPGEVALAASATPTCAAMLAYRAMERAGNRLRSLSAIKPDPAVPAHTVHTVVKVFPDRVDAILEHAWATAVTFNVPEEEIDRARNYTRFLLTESASFELDVAVSYIRNGIHGP